MAGEAKIHNPPELLFSRKRAETGIEKVIQFPLIRIIIALIFIAPAILFFNLVMIYFTETLEKPIYYYSFAVQVVIAFLFLIIMYRWYTRKIEKRAAFEFSMAGFLKEFCSGVGIGGGMICLLVGLLAILSFYRIESAGPPLILIYALFLFGFGAFVQELLFRVIIFRNLEERWGTWTALVTIALIFGLFHIGNENSTVWTTAALMLEDIILTAVFVLTRRVWMVWGLHFGWNLFQDGVFGMSNSGVEQFPSWLSPQIEGPALLTGGAFGIEASLPAVLLNFLIGLTIILFIRKHYGLVRPARQRSET